MIEEPLTGLHSLIKKGKESREAGLKPSLYHFFKR
jgi:hypothetical protein